MHSNADKAQVGAVQSLFEKGLVSHSDGGYLTDLGRQAAEHAQALMLILGGLTKYIYQAYWSFAPD